MLRARTVDRTNTVGTESSRRKSVSKAPERPRFPRRQQKDTGRAYLRPAETYLKQSPLGLHVCSDEVIDAASIRDSAPVPSRRWELRNAASRSWAGINQANGTGATPLARPSPFFRQFRAPRGNVSATLDDADGLAASSSAIPGAADGQKCPTGCRLVYYRELHGDLYIERN